MSALPLRARRKRATRLFVLRVGLLLAALAAIIYSAWLAPWAKPIRSIPVVRM